MFWLYIISIGEWEEGTSSTVLGVGSPREGHGTPFLVGIEAVEPEGTHP